MSTLARQRCFQHSEREAVARCPECQRFFCGECITEHGERLICAGCLARLSAVARAPRTWPRKAGSIFCAGAGVVAGWLFFYALGRLLMTVPSTFHNSALWSHWTE